MVNSRDFHRILIVFSWHVTLEKACKKNLKKAIKNHLIFQFSRAMKTLKFWANPWNTHENTMNILGCFHGLLMALKVPWITKKDFHGVVVHGLFMRPLNSWLIKNPWLFHYYWKINRSWKMFMVFWWLFEDPWKLIIQWPSTIFMA